MDFKYWTIYSVITFFITLIGNLVFWTVTKKRQKSLNSSNKYKSISIYLLFITIFILIITITLAIIYINKSRIVGIINNENLISENSKNLTGIDSIETTINREIDENTSKTSVTDETTTESKNSFTYPTIVGSCEITFPSYSIFLEEQKLYILDGDGFDIINISDKNNPVLENTYNTNYRTYSSCVWNNCIFLDDFDNNVGFSIIENINNNLELSGKFSGFESVDSLSAMGDYVYAGVGETLQVIDIKDKKNPKAVTEVRGFSNINDIYTTNKYIYTLDDNKGVAIFNIIDNKIKFISEYKIKDLVNLKVFAEGSFVYVIGYYRDQQNYKGSLQIIDFKDLNNPYLCGTYEIEGYPNDVFVKNDYAFVVDGNNNLQIINIQNKNKPSLVGQIDIKEDIRNIYVKDNYIYITTSLTNEIDGNKEYKYYLKVMQIIN